MAPSDEPIVVEVGRATSGQDEVIVAGGRRRGWTVAATSSALVIGAVIGWSAHGSAPRAPAAVVPARASAAPPSPVGCPDGATVRPMDVLGSDDLIAALHANFPAFAVVGGVRGFSGSTGPLCGATLVGREPDGVTVDVTVARGLARGPSQVTRLEQDGPNVRSELVRVTPQGWTIDVLVHGPTGDRAPTRAMSRLANDPRLTNPT
jgi:hypothetical protein